MYLDITATSLQQLGAFHTAKEITQQPDSANQVLISFKEQKKALHAFTKGFLEKSNARIILTGAGTSEFAGNSIVSYLQNALDKLPGTDKKRIDSIGSTELVSNPSLYFDRTTPTLLVSFARSGNSPESVEATKLADALVDDCYHLAITCNKKGHLYQTALIQDNHYAFLMPEETNDVSFAMTSSFTSMMIGALLSFDYNGNIEKSVPKICNVMRLAISAFNKPIKALADKKYSRVIYLGSGVFKSLSEESALKLLELTDGGTAVMFNSPLGFRHGPKSFINNDTLVVVMVSNDPHTQKYDLDLINEVRNDNIARDVVTINAPDSIVESALDFKFDNAAALKDVELLLPFISWAQIFATHSSLTHGITPDTPCASGAVNRVVQGVILHELK